MSGKSADPGVIVGPSRMSDAVPFEEAVQHILHLRREHDARPEVIEKKAQDARDREMARLGKLAAKGKDAGLIGPPDPRKGRLPMTR